MRKSRVSARNTQWPGHLLIVLAACGLISGCSPLQGSARIPAGIDLSGQWHQNESQSDSLEALLNSIREDLDPAPRRTGVPTGANDGRLVGRRDEFFGPPRTKEMIALLKQPADFQLTQSSQSLTMKSIDGTTEYVYGEAVVVSLPDGVGDRRCGWAGNQFVVDIRAVDGRRIEHRVGLSKDRAQLSLTTSVSGDGLPTVTLRRSYDRDDGQQ